jgi:hypothetical protein
MNRIGWIAAAAAALALVLPVPGSAEQRIIAPDLARVTYSGTWTVHHAAAELVQVDGKQAVRLTAEGDSANGIVGLALVNALEFLTGTIELDLKGRWPRAQPRRSIHCLAGAHLGKTAQGTAGQVRGARQPRPRRGRLVPRQNRGGGEAGARVRERIECALPYRGPACGRREGQADGPLCGQRRGIVRKPEGHHDQVGETLRRMPWCVIRFGMSTLPRGGCRLGPPAETSGILARGSFGPAARS